MATQPTDEPLAYDRDGGDWNRGDQIIDEQRSTYDVFMGLTKWGGLAVVAVVAWATLAFATKAGVMTAFVIAAVIAAAGWWFLRDKPSDHEPDRRP